MLLLFVLSLLFLNYLLQDRNIVQGYYKLETYGDKEKFQHYVEYYKYYYDADKNTEFYLLKKKNQSENTISNNFHRAWKKIFCNVYEHHKKY